jgi:GH18 family chitinase
MGSSSGGTPQGGADSGVDSAGPPTSSGSGSGSSSGGVAHDAGGAPDTGGGARHDAGGNNPSPEAGDDSGGGDDATGGPSEGGTVVVPDTKVVMYLPNWSGSFSSWANMIDFTKMTHLLLAFGTTGSSNDWSLGASDSDVQTLAAAAHSNNVKILVSIGGADDDIGIINQYQDASNIGPLVANLDAFISRLNLDGVDVDLERGSDMKSSSNYPAFIKQLISTFHPEGKLVTTALAQYIVQDANSDAALQAVLQSFDFINDMIYTTNMNDYTSEASWWISTQGIAKTQLVWGIEFGNGLSADTAKQIATASKDYGGTMIWEYSQPTEPQLWPAVQSVF